MILAWFLDTPSFKARLSVHRISFAGQTPDTELDQCFKSVIHKASVHVSSIYGPRGRPSKLVISLRWIVGGQRALHRPARPTTSEPVRP
ncbi:hypothetical protein CPC08DRAFT_176355 [Agrocybe pediades]|nr:hypothetical protein CPC08DRAFT_176355 [Agrocybe pediades]